MNRLFVLMLAAALLTPPVLWAQKTGGTVTAPIITSSFIRNFNPFTQAENIGPARGFMYEPLLFHNNQRDRIEYRLAAQPAYRPSLHVANP